MVWEQEHGRDANKSEEAPFKNTAWTFWEKSISVGLAACPGGERGRDPDLQLSTRWRWALDLLPCRGCLNVEYYDRGAGEDA